ncbi:hypothetical protein LO772_04990 [Yinghuangia sp. ASG 101]|uniref:DUF6882 domain-containing protein n=1 Tax=Yinghuangia sp. ASG 101 TaxID=2896848 RepID=UPI001E4E7D95|nr:DUF6882 domain-containing protein [Yinghuangia sp. ASG 101]UGQ12981.1 hypothetical protein LO772_04990 [Yinghuangia sp. ASG 101]
MSGHDFFSDALVRAAAPHGAWVAEQLDAFNAFMPIGEWRVNLDERVYRQSGREIEVSVLGSFSTGDDTWLWGWANPSWRDPAVASAAAALRAIGDRDGIPEFRRELVDLSRFADPRMAAETLAYAAMGLLGSAGYIGVTANPTGRLYMLTDDRRIPRARPDAITLPRVLITGAGFLPVPAEDVVRGYLAHHGLPCRRTENPQGTALGAELADGDIVAIDIDPQGRITRVGVTAAPRTVPSRAWWRAAGAGLVRVLEQDGTFTAFVAANPYRDHDLDERVLYCGTFDIRVRVLGALDASGTHWTWDADTRAHLTEHPALANAPEAAAAIDLSGCAAPDAAARLLSHGAAGLLGGGCCVDLLDEHGTVFVTVDDPRVPPATTATAAAEALRGAADVVAALVAEPKRAEVVTALAEDFLGTRGRVERDEVSGEVVLRVAELTVRVGTSGAVRVDASAA